MNWPQTYRDQVFVLDGWGVHSNAIIPSLLSIPLNEMVSNQPLIRDQGSSREYKHSLSRHPSSQACHVISVSKQLAPYLIQSDLYSSKACHIVGIMMWLDTYIWVEYDKAYTQKTHVTMIKLCSSIWRLRSIINTSVGELTWLFEEYKHLHSDFS